MTPNKDREATSCCSGMRKILIPVIIAFILFYVSKDFSVFSMSHIYPFALLLTKYRQENSQAWEKYAPINKAITYPLRPIPEINSTDYTVENMRQATDNYRRPVVVRGLFKDSTAVEKWESREYLPSAFGDCVIPVVRDGSVGTLQDDREIEPFGQAFHRVFDSDYSNSYLFFPAKSRVTFKGIDDDAGIKLEKIGNQIVKRDLNLEKIRPGFSTPADKLFVSAQFVIGKAPTDLSITPTGSDFHCAAGNNWFIQVAGRKRWEFIMPKYSASLWPLKGGLFNFWNGQKDMLGASPHIPREYVDLEPGDMLFNPPWQWHKIVNYPGLSIGVPVREQNFYNTLVNNPYFFFIISLNLLLAKVDLSLGGFPPPSAATEHDN